MPYKKVSDSKLRKLDNISLSLGQVNEIAAMADAIGDNGWAISISNFKKSHTVVNGAWVAKELDTAWSDLYVQKSGDGRYRLVGVSTAAVPDQEGETFTVDAIDGDIRQAEATGKYPEFRMFHNSSLGIGRVDKMRRVGIFGIDEGWSYTDPFSLACCEAISKDNSGKWRMSRGFYAYEVAGKCNCGTNLVLKAEQLMGLGYKCPVCGTANVRYKGALRDVSFRKTQTFDVTITDIPCNPWTGVTAIKEDDIMKPAQLKQKLLDAGVDAELVEERLATLNPAQLKQLEGMDDVPMAEVLKEVGLEEVDDAEAYVDDDGAMEVEEKELLDAIGAIVQREVTAALEDLEVTVAMPETKELSDDVYQRLDAIEEGITQLKEAVAVLLSGDNARLKEMIDGAPRSAKFRILRQKAAVAADEEEDVEDGEEPMPMKGKKGCATKKELDAAAGLVYGANGQTYGSLSAAVLGGE